MFVDVRSFVTLSFYLVFEWTIWKLDYCQVLFIFPCYSNNRSSDPHCTSKQPKKHCLWKIFVLFLKRIIFSAHNVFAASVKCCAHNDHLETGHFSWSFFKINLSCSDKTKSKHELNFYEFIVGNQNFAYGVE